MNNSLVNCQQAHDYLPVSSPTCPATHEVVRELIHEVVREPRH